MESTSEQAAVRASTLLNMPGNAASIAISRTTPLAIQNTGLRFRSCQASAERLAMADPGIEYRVQQVDDEIGGQVDHDQQAHDSHHQRTILEPDSLEQATADAGDVEYPLGDHGAPHQRAKIGANEGHDRDQRVTKHVHAHGASVGESLRGGSAHVVC